MVKHYRINSVRVGNQDEMFGMMTPLPGGLDVRYTAPKSQFGSLTVNSVVTATPRKATKTLRGTRTLDLKEVITPGTKGYLRRFFQGQK